MSTHFPAVTAKEVVRVLLKLGFVFRRQAGGSHAIYYHVVTNQRTVVPMHASTILKRKTLKSILNDAEITLAEFRALL